GGGRTGDDEQRVAVEAVAVEVLRRGEWMLPERRAGRQVAPDQLSVGRRPLAAVNEHAATDLHPGGDVSRLGPKDAGGGQIVLGQARAARPGQNQKSQTA